LPIANANSFPLNATCTLPVILRLLIKLIMLQDFGDFNFGQFGWRGVKLRQDRQRLLTR
jgi:hypothetical protein